VQAGALSWGVSSVKLKGMSETRNDMSVMREFLNAASTKTVRGRLFSGGMVQLNTRAPAKITSYLAETFCECACADTWGAQKTLSFLSAEQNTRTKHLSTPLFSPFGTRVAGFRRHTFEASTEELCRPLRAAGEFPSEPARTLRLRRMRASVRSSTYYELLADLSDNTSIGKRSLKKACRFAFKP